MTVLEYNKEFLPKITKAALFIKNLEHAAEKSGAYHDVIRQLKINGWSDELKDTILTALRRYQEEGLAQVKMEVSALSGDTSDTTISVREILRSEKLTTEEADALAVLLRKAM